MNWKPDIIGWLLTCSLEVRHDWFTDDWKYDMIGLLLI